MPYLPTLEAYLHQSSLLLQAHPLQTRITTTYNVSPQDPFTRRSKPQKSSKKYTRTKDPRIIENPSPASSRPSGQTPDPTAPATHPDTAMPDALPPPRTAPQNPAQKPSEPPLPTHLSPAGFTTAVADKEARLGKVGTWTLKTCFVGSGVVLKYRTTKAAEVGRLMAGLGRLGGGMSRGVLEGQGDEHKVEGGEGGEGEGVKKEAGVGARVKGVGKEEGKEEGKGDGKVEGPGRGQGQGGGGKKNKKKGKK